MCGRKVSYEDDTIDYEIRLKDYFLCGYSLLNDIDCLEEVVVEKMLPPTKFWPGYAAEDVSCD